jgi:mRNA-degrading endonuclease RelE of RelBE toxin-antitoxin system
LPPFRIDITEPTFQRDLRDAKKRHSTVAQDLKETLEALEKDHAIGTWIPGLNAHVRKVRLGVKRQNIGKSCGYRLIYLVDEDTHTITPLLFHYKPELDLVPNAEIMKIIKGITERQAPPRELSIRPDLLN